MKGDVFHFKILPSAVGQQLSAAGGISLSYLGNCSAEAPIIPQPVIYEPITLQTTRSVSRLSAAWCTVVWKIQLPNILTVQLLWMDI